MKQNESRADRLADATDMIRAGLDEVEELKEEITEWLSNMINMKFENPKEYRQMEEIWDTLEGAFDVIDSACSDLECIEFPE